MVQNLFYNVPARRKFLKSAVTEFRHVYDEVQRIAVSRPDIALHFINDEDTVFNLKPAPLLQRLSDVLGERRCEGLIAVEENSPALALRGYIGKPAFGVRTRQGQYLFLNGRYIVNRTIAHAVTSAYEHLMDKGTFPFFLLFLTADTRTVDVNVHPSKLEAKFEDEQMIHRVVSSVVRRALGGAESVPALTIQDGGIEPGTVAARFTLRQHAWPAGGSGSLWNFPERGEIDTRTGEILPFVPSPGVADGASLAARLLDSPAKGEGEQRGSSRHTRGTASPRGRAAGARGGDAHLAAPQQVHTLPDPERASHRRSARRTRARAVRKGPPEVHDKPQEHAAAPLPRDA